MNAASRRLTGSRIFPCLATVAAVACGPGNSEVLIGLAAPLSEPRGESMRAGAELAVLEINDAGGIDGRPVRLVALDDSARTDVAIRVAQRVKRMYRRTPYVTY